MTAHGTFGNPITITEIASTGNDTNWPPNTIYPWQPNTVPFYPAGTPSPIYPAGTPSIMPTTFVPQFIDYDALAEAVAAKLLPKILEALQTR